MTPNPERSHTMFTTRDGQAASNGRPIVANGPSPCGYLEFYMIKPKLPAQTRVHRGGVAPPKA
jgi:hypothetical protein